MSGTTTRREFLKTGITLAGVPCFVPAQVLGAGGATVPSEKIVLGCIGVGSMGGGHVRGWLGQEDVQLTAVCDLRQSFRQKAKLAVDRKYGNQDCKAFKDFRELENSNWPAAYGIVNLQKYLHVGVVKRCIYNISLTPNLSATMIEKVGAVDQF